MHTFINNSFGDRYLHEVNGNSFNKYGASNTITNRFGPQFLKEEFIYIVIGTDSGLIPKYLIEQGIPTGTEYIFIESDELYPTIQSVFPAHAQLHLCSSTNWQALADELNLPLYIQANCAHQVDSFGVTTGHHAPYAELTATAKKEFNAIVTSALKNAELFDFFKMGLLNLADDQHSISTLIKEHGDDTAVILGAGPSLDQHVEWIREHQQQLHIFAVSRISNKLKSEGITPDYIVTVDSQDFSYEAGKAAFQFEKHATLVHSFHANSQLVGQWMGNKVFTGDRFPWSTPNNRDCVAQNGTTVTNVAYDAAVTMGFGKILLAGVDFCHDTDGFTHAKGTGSESACAPALDHRQSMFVTNNRGEQAETTPEFKNAGADFSTHAESATEKGITTINLSSGAMKMDHVHHQAHDQISLPTAEKVLTINSNQSTAEFYKRCLKELNKARSELKRLSTQAKEAIQKNHTLFDQYGQKNPKIDKQLNKLDKKLADNKNPFIPLIKMIGLRDSLKFLRATRKKDHSWTQEELTESNIAYLKTFQKNTGRLIKVIESSIGRIKSREMELSLSAERVPLLLKQWIEDKHPRRVALLEEGGWIAAPSDEIQQQLQALKAVEEKINEITYDVAATHETKVKDSFFSITNLTGKNDLDGLQFLYKKLSHQPDTESKFRYLSLCGGMLAYLKKEKQEAFNTLADLLGKSDQFDENELEYILAKVSMIALELKDYANAKVALETLSQTFSPFYIPKYAELLYLTGEVEKALNTYEQYISQYPDDLDTVFSLAELQRKEGVDEAALALYQFILSRKPDYAPAVHRIAELQGQ